MRKTFLQFIFSISFLLIAGIATAQTNSNSNTSTIETTMRSDGKIYVVMAVCITILIGFILYLISIDRKIKKIEKND
jgi:hypothetical protein